MDIIKTCFSSIQNNPRILFLFVFLYTLAVSLFVQMLVLPAIPDLHAGVGLLKGGDAFSFHTGAIELVRKMESVGFIDAFVIRYDGQAPASVTAILYWLSGVELPWIVLPLNCLLFASAVVIINRTLSRNFTSRAAFISCLAIILLPSSAAIYSQIHKDIYVLFGFSLLVLLIDYVFNRLERSFGSLVFVAVIAACAGFCVWLVRPYLIKVVSLGIVSIAVIALLHWLFFKRESKGLAALFSITIIFCCFFSWDLLKVNSSKGFAFEGDYAAIARQAKRAELISLAHYSEAEGCHVASVNEHSPIYDKLLLKIYDTRRGFISYKDAGSNIDAHVNFCSWGQLIGYAPKAILVGLAAPFPNMWFEEGKSPGGRLMRSVSGIEMIYFYFALLGLLVLIMKRDRVNLFVISSSVLMLSVILVYALVVTNVGTLYRMRFSALHILACLGVCSWLHFVLLSKKRDSEDAA